MIVSKKNIQVQGSHQRIMLTDCFYNENAKEKPVVIYLHGFNGFKDWGNFDLIAKQFAEAGFFFIKFNFSHNGTTVDSSDEFVDLEAFGRNNFSIELNDVDCMLNWLFNKANPFANEINLQNVSLLGHSKGGGVAIIKSYEDARISSLVTWASIHECKTPWGNMKAAKLEQWKQEGVMYYSNKRTNQQMPLYYQLMEDYLTNERRLNIQDAMMHLKKPMLICHGNQDPAVSVNSAILLSTWKPDAALYLLDSDHVFDRKHPWLENELPQAMQSVLTKSINFLKMLND